MICLYAKDCSVQFSSDIYLHQTTYMFLLYICLNLCRRTHKLRWYRVHCALYSSMKNDSLFVCFFYRFIFSIIRWHMCHTLTANIVLLLQFIRLFFWLFKQLKWDSIRFIWWKKHTWNIQHFYHSFPFGMMFLQFWTNLHSNTI